MDYIIPEYIGFIDAEHIYKMGTGLRFSIAICTNNLVWIKGQPIIQTMPKSENNPKGRWIVSPENIEKTLFEDWVLIGNSKLIKFDKDNIDFDMSTHLISNLINVSNFVFLDGFFRFNKIDINYQYSSKVPNINKNLKLYILRLLKSELLKMIGTKDYLQTYNDFIRIENEILERQSYYQKLLNTISNANGLLSPEKLQTIKNEYNKNVNNGLLDSLIKRKTKLCSELKEREEKIFSLICD